MGDRLESKRFYGFVMLRVHSPILLIGIKIFVYFFLLFHHLIMLLQKLGPVALFS